MRVATTKISVAGLTKISLRQPVSRERGERNARRRKVDAGCHQEKRCEAGEGDRACPEPEIQTRTVRFARQCEFQLASFHVKHSVPSLATYVDIIGKAFGAVKSESTTTLKIADEATFARPPSIFSLS